MTIAIKFINPFGTGQYNGLITETLTPYVREGTEVVVANTSNCPENIDYYYSKHLIEEAIFEEVIKAEEERFDAVIVGCCYDPGVRVARELVDIPVIGPLEAAMYFAPYFGHDYVVVTDHHKAVPYLRDLVRLYGQQANCLDVSCINWFVADMIKDTDGVARDAMKAAEAAMTNNGAEAAILGCTIISASYEKLILQTGEQRNRAVLNPNTCALKMAESLADLSRQGVYQISRGGITSSSSNITPSSMRRCENGSGTVGRARFENDRRFRSSACSALRQQADPLRFRSWLKVEWLTRSSSIRSYRRSLQIRRYREPTHREPR